MQLQLCGAQNEAAHEELKVQVCTEKGIKDLSIVIFWETVIKRLRILASLHIYLIFY